MPSGKLLAKARCPLTDARLLLDALLADVTDRIVDSVAARLAEVVKNSRPVDELQDEPTMAKLLGVSSQTLKRRRKKGEVPYVRLGRRVLYNPAAVFDAVSKNSNGGASA